MRYYETLYIINPDLTDDAYREVVDKMNALIEREKGVMIRVEEWGKRTLAYQVKKFDRGSYVLLQYCGESGIVDKLKREMTLDDRTIKYQTIKLSDHADPEALKAAAAEGTKERPVEDDKTTDDDRHADDEVEDGIQ